MLALIRKYLGKLFGMEQTAEQIVSPLTKIVDKLEQHAYNQEIKAAENDKKAKELLEKADISRADSRKAHEFSQNVGKLLGAK